LLLDIAMSLGNQLLKRFRDRRVEMVLKISRNAAVMLNCMLRQPNLFPLAQAGMQKPFSAEGLEMSKQIITLRRWFEVEVVKFDRKKKEDTLKWPEDGEFTEAKLPKSYVGVLKKMLEYYKPFGLLVDFAEMYIECQLCLEGKTIEDELDTLDELKAEPATKDEVAAEASKIDKK
jgi:hypothetical protein